MANGFDFNRIATSIGTFVLGAGIYLFVAPRLLSNPPFIQNNQIYVPGLSPEAVAAEEEAAMAGDPAALAGAVTYADDRVSGVFPYGVRLGGAY